MSRTVLITGAARGIGAATARRLHARGARLVLLDRDAEELSALAASLGGDVLACPADVTDVGDLDRAVAAGIERFGGLDVAIANAGVAPVGSIADSPPEEIERTIEINLLGVWRTDRAVLPAITERRGYILNVASMAAAGQLPLMGAYAASKAGVEAFTNVLRMELRPAGVAVGCAYFGWIDTDMVRTSLTDPAGRAVHRLLPGALGRPAGVDAAARVLEDAVARRAERALFPSTGGAALALRGVTQPLSERILAARSGAVERALALAGR